MAVCHHLDCLKAEKLLKDFRTLAELGHTVILSIHQVRKHGLFSDLRSFHMKMLCHLLCTSQGPRYLLALMMSSSWRKEKVSIDVGGRETAQTYAHLSRSD